MPPTASFAAAFRNFHAPAANFNAGSNGGDNAACLIRPQRSTQGMERKMVRHGLLISALLLIQLTLVHQLLII
jgi:hypothetical protein